MPDTLQGWMWWGFTAVIVGLVINIGANFLTPLARRGGESWFQRRRLKHEKYRAGIEELVKQLKNDPPVAYLYLGYRTIIIIVTTVLILALELFVFYIMTIAHALKQTDSYRETVALFIIAITGITILAMWQSLANYVLDIYNIYPYGNKPEEEE